MCNGEKSKLTRSIMVYDASSLYLYCSGDAIPCGKDTLVLNKKPFDQKRITKFSKDVLKGSVFRFAQVDIEVPDALYDKFSEMSPLFVVQGIPDCDIPEEMKIYKKNTGRKTVKGRKTLLGVMKPKKILLYTPLMIEWYLQYWPRLTMVHQLIEYEPGMPFSWFPDEVANARCEADKDPLKKHLCDVAKLKGNSFFGKIIEDLCRHKSTKFTRKEMVVDKALRSPFFDDLEETNGAYQIKEFKRTAMIQDLISVALLCIN